MSTEPSNCTGMGNIPFDTSAGRFAPMLITQDAALVGGPAPV